MGNKPIGFATEKRSAANLIGLLLPIKQQNHLHKQWLIPVAQGGLQAMMVQDTFNIEIH
jgi:hypothetical protein